MSPIVDLLILLSSDFDVTSTKRKKSFQVGSRGGINNIMRTLANTIIPTTDTRVLNGS